MLIKELLQIQENFGALEKLTAADIQYFNMDTPADGPALLAKYKANDEIILGLGVDLDDEEGRIRVAIENPDTGSSHVKYFDNTKDGYNQARDYANSLLNTKVKL